MEGNYTLTDTTKAGSGGLSGDISRLNCCELTVRLIVGRGGGATHNIVLIERCDGEGVCGNWVRGRGGCAEVVIGTNERHPHDVPAYDTVFKNIFFQLGRKTNCIASQFDCGILSSDVVKYTDVMMDTVIKVNNAINNV